MVKILKIKKIKWLTGIRTTPMKKIMLKKMIIKIRKIIMSPSHVVASLLLDKIKINNSNIKR